MLPSPATPASPAWRNQRREWTARGLGDWGRSQENALPGAAAVGASVFAVAVFRLGKAIRMLLSLSAVSAEAIRGLEGSDPAREVIVSTRPHV